ncbi:MAG: Kelch repeat-containing protein [Verrucomicrobiia bacterium]
MKTQLRAIDRRRWTFAFGAALASCLGLSLQTALATPGSWIRKAAMPMAIAGPAACELDGILYVAGGETNSWAYPIRSLLAYDPKTDAWTRKADMPTARSGPVAAAVDGIVYVIGGGNLGAGWETNVVEIYDPKTDTWTSKNPMPTARIHADACALNGLIYVIGGMRDGGVVALAAVECYDPKTDQWTRKQNLPQATSSPVVEVVDGTIYVFADTGTFAYDPAADQWTSKAQIPAGFGTVQSAGATVDGVVYLFGGLSDSFCAHKLSLAYDPVQNQFASRREMPEPSVVAASATMDGKIYVVGGASGSPFDCPTFTYYDSLWVFDPQGGEYPRIQSFAPEANNTFQLVWQADVGRLYGIQDTRDLVKGPWRFINSIRATNELMQVHYAAPPGDAVRFFRVCEKD